MKTGVLSFKLIFTFLFFLINSIPSYANNFKLDKTRIILDESKRREEIRIYNDSDILQTFKISLIEMKMDENGNLVVVKDYENSAQPYLRIGPRISRDVPPYSFQKVRIIKKKSPKPGEYRSHLMIEALNEEPIKQLSGVYVRPNLKYIIPIFVSQSTEQSVLEFGKPFMKDNGEVVLSLKRKGETSVSGNIVVLDKNNEEVFRANQVSVYPEIEQRTLDTETIFDNSVSPFTIQLEDPLLDNEVTVQQVMKF